MKKFSILFILLVTVFSAFNTSAQRRFNITVFFDGEETLIEYNEIHGMYYVSAVELAKAFAGAIYYNSKAAKAEIKLRNYNIKITGRNQFISLVSPDSKKQKLYQIPLSTLMARGDVIVPLDYMIPYLEMATGYRLDYDKKRRIIKTGEASPVASHDPDLRKSSSFENVDSDFDLFGIALEERSNGTLIKLTTSRELPGFRSALRNETLFLFLTGISVDPALEEKFKAEGLVSGLSIKKVAQTVQLEFPLKKGITKHETFKDPETGELIITLHNKLLDNKTEIKDPGLVEITPEKIKEEKEKHKWEFDCIVIDPGHGGRDGGAVGYRGTREKDVNLKIALKLGNLISKNMDSVKVVYTRKDDTFLELYKRGQIANENNGKLFISIHCNSYRKKPSKPRGFEVYLLRPGRTKEAIEIAEFENSVIEFEENPGKYKKLTDENFILVSMAHSSYMRYSEKFSDILNNNWLTGASIPSRGIKQAGFYVLVGASMPGVLIEAGFLSNREDEQYLRSDKGQNQIARTLFKSVREFKNYYDKSLNGS